MPTAITDDVRADAVGYIAARSVPQPNGCRLWQLREGSEGYGAAYFGGQKIAAHRFSYEVHHGPIPDGMCVCHTCDTRMCVNPDHLWLGTIGENNTDRHRKGRCGKGSFCAVHGEGRSALRPEQVSAVMKLLDQGVTHKVIAAQFGVSRQLVTKLNVQRVRGAV